MENLKKKSILQYNTIIFDYGIKIIRLIIASNPQK